MIQKSQINSIYSFKCDCCDGYYTLSFSKLVGIFSIIDKVVDALWKRSSPKGNKPFNLDQPVMLKEYDSLFDAVQEGIGRPAAQMAYSDTRFDTLQRLRINLVTFVAFKNYQQRSEMIKELVDEKGNIRPYSDFKRKCYTISQDYNDNWLQAEYATTVAATQTAVQWKTFQDQKHIFPYLIYKTQDDRKVRKAHQALHNIIKGIDDVFWDRYYPPNGWRCRCYVLQSKGPASGESPTLDDKDQPPAFRFNSGKDQKVFDKKHPYFDIAKSEDKKKVLEARNEFLKDKKFYDRVGNIDVHVSNYFANQDFEHELQIGQRIAEHFGINDLKMNTQIDNDGVTLPDFFNDDIVIEYKNTTTTDRTKLATNASKALNQITNSEHKDKKKYVLLRIADSVDKNRLIKTIYKFKEDFELLFIDQLNNITLNKKGQ